jgi:hypothetical protein
MPRLFLSYRREDTGGYAGRLGDGLSARFGRSQIFRDIDAIPPGVNFVKGTDDAIAACDYVLLLIGDNWLSAATKAGDRRLDDPDDFVRREIEAAIKGDVPIIPILVEGARMPTAAWRPSRAWSRSRAAITATMESAAGGGTWPIFCPTSSSTSSQCATSAT